MTVFTEPEKTSQAELIAEIARLKAANASKFKCQIGQKGGVSVYGFGRWPVTLYASQWEDLISYIPTVKAFLDANRSKLATKGE